MHTVKNNLYNFSYRNIKPTKTVSYLDMSIDLR